MLPFTQWSPVLSTVLKSPAEQIKERCTVVEEHEPGEQCT